MTDQQTAEPQLQPAQLREAPSDLLADLRAKIDVIDAKLSALIVERLAIADEIGERKRGRNPADSCAQARRGTARKTR